MKLASLPFFWSWFEASYFPLDHVDHVHVVQIIQNTLISFTLHTPNQTEKIVSLYSLYKQLNSLKTFILLRIYLTLQSLYNQPNNP